VGDLNNLDLSDFFSAVSVGSSTDEHIRLKAVGASAVVPAIPSVIVSVVSV